MKLKPIRVRFLEKHFRRKVGRKTVPHHHHLGTVIMMNARQKENHILRVRGPLERGKTKMKIMTSRTSRDEAEHRVIVTPRRLKKNRRFTDRRPGGADCRSEKNSTFIP